MKRTKTKPATCYVIRCTRPAGSTGLCVAHATRLKRKGSVDAFRPIGPPRGRAARKPRKAAAS